MKKILTQVIDNGNNVERACKAQIIQALHSSDVNKTSSCIKACMECNQVIEVASFFIASGSPNTKTCLSLSIKTIKTCIKECKKLENNKCCKKTSTYCIKICNEYLDSLGKLKKLI